MAHILDGKATSKQIKEEIKKEVQLIKEKCRKDIGLAVVQVGDNAASNTYINNKKKACEEVGMKFHHIKFNDFEAAMVLDRRIFELNETEEIDGIIIQLPLPENTHKDIEHVLVSDYKDVDCFSYTNLGKLFVGKSEMFGMLPCTPSGIVQLLKRNNIEIAGKKVVVVGRSNIVGKPIAMMLLNENATVTICHSKTENLAEETKRADILIVAVGQREMITADYVKEGAVVIDVGIHRKEDGKLCGDVKFDEVYEKIGENGWITPVPGGVGPMTVTMLLQNTLNAAKNRLVYESSYTNGYKVIG